MEIDLPQTAYEHPGARYLTVYPYLLDGHCRSNGPITSWARPILTYLPMAHEGFPCISVAIIDVGSRTDALLAGIEQPMTLDFCVEAPAGMALEKYGKPEIFNTDQGIAIYSGGNGSIRSRRPECRSAWTARVDGSTTYLSNACGAA